MKKNVILHILFTTALLLTIGCGSRKNTPQVPKDEVALSFPCMGPEYASNTDFFRMSASAEDDYDPMQAKEEAFGKAQGLLVISIENTIKRVSDDYIKKTQANDAKETLKKFERNTREVVSRKLKNSKIFCEQPTKDKSTGTYKYYIAIQVSVNDIKSDLLETLSQDQSLKVDYNYKKFKETFENEMNKLENN